MASVLSDLVQRRRAVEASLQGVTKIIKEKMRSEQSRLTPHVAAVVCILFAERKDPRSAVVAYLRQQRTLQDYSDEALIALAERTFAETDVGLIQHMTSDGHAFVKERQLARNLLCEQNLFDWCIAVNVAKGLAPSSRAVVSKACELGISPKSNGAARLWAHRWRKRWNVRMETLRACARPPQREAAAKVSLHLRARSTDFCINSAVHFAGSKCGP